VRIRQKRRVQLDFRDDSNEEVIKLTVGDLRNFLKTLNEHKLSNEQSIEFYRHPYKFGFVGMEAEWEEWASE